MSILRKAHIMAKQLVRCINGHVFDVLMQPNCPRCGEQVDSGIQKEPGGSSEVTITEKTPVAAARTGSKGAALYLWIIGATIIAGVAAGLIWRHHGNANRIGISFANSISHGGSTSHAASPVVAKENAGGTGDKKLSNIATPQSVGGNRATANPHPVGGTQLGAGDAAASNPTEQAIGNGDFSSGMSYLPAPGHAPNYALAKLWFTRAVQAGSGDGMYGMGLLYAKGWGVLKNYKTALKWYRRGAAAGSGLAMAGLSNLYATGKGTKKNLQKYMYWAQKAATTGFR